MRYRNLGHFNLHPDDIAKIYRVDDPAFYPPTRVAPSFSKVPIKPRNPGPTPPETYADALFLKNVPRVCMTWANVRSTDSTANFEKCKGIKILRSTPNNAAGLFQLEDPTSPQNGQHVVIKEISEARNEVTFKGLHMKGLGQNGDSIHTFNLISTKDQPHRLSKDDLRVNALKAEWLGKCRRLYMEYCPLGSLWDLVIKQIDLWASSIWLIRYAWNVALTWL